MNFFAFKLYRLKQKSTCKKESDQFEFYFIIIITFIYIFQYTILPARNQEPSESVA